MSTTLAFLPWARFGLGAALRAPEGSLRGQVPIDVQVGGQIGAASAPAVSAPPLTAQTLGPGDVLGIDPRVVIRTDPGPYAQGVPAHTLASIEFSRPDFPWLFSPLAPDGQQRLQPWLCLLVVPRRSGISLRARDGGLQVLSVDAASELPNLAEAWAWAHAQTLSGDAASPASAGEPGRVSRLVSPRRLEPATAYYACLVPTFNVGRQVGLDPTAEPQGPLAPAWSGAIGAGFELPVYYAWSFATGGAGDFHDLVAKLKAEPLPAEVGSRPLSIGFPTAPAPAGFAPFNAPLEGVLRNLADPLPPADAAAASAVGKELLRVTGLARTVAPPRYGQAQAIAVAPWLGDLNSTPTARLAAATGARVVQAEQEALMAAAWEQIGEMQRANQQRRRADVALAVGNALVDRHLAVMAPNRMLQVSAPSGIPTAGGKTAAAVVARVPPTTLGATFRRLQRRTGSLARRSAAISDAGISMLGLPGATGPSAMSVLSPSRLQAADPATVNAKAPAVLPFPEGDGTPPGRTSAHVTYRFTGLIQPRVGRPSTITRFSSIWSASVPWRLDDGSQFQSGGGAGANFKAAAFAAQQYLVGQMLPRTGAMPVFTPAPPSVDDAQSARAGVLDGLRPVRTLVGRFGDDRPPLQVAAPIGAAPAPAPAPGPAALAELRHDPVFPQGMHRALAELAPDLFLVGVDRMPDNSVGLVRTNPRFIEAYLAGLNHEMGRELLWRGFPSDGRGTYFRRFWDGEDYPALSAWRGALGANAPAADWLVLLIRGEIVRRFPRAAVFAQRGALDAAGATFVPAAEPRRYPRFRVTVGGDLLCVGFDLTRAQALDYFFGIEEPLTEPRFAAPVGPAGLYVQLSDLPLRAGAHAGDVAAATLRRPVRVLIDPHVLIP